MERLQFLALRGLRRGLPLDRERVWDGEAYAGSELPTADMGSA
jgi:hypothetical protein